jgi:SUN domain-containing protein 1/2
MHETSPSFKKGFLSKLLPIGGRSQPPSVVFRGHDENGLKAGDCWCFNGHGGKIAVALPMQVIPTEFTIEHLPPLPYISRSSAPRHFEVWAYSEMSAKSEKTLLVTSVYRLDGPARQVFKSSVILNNPTSLIQLRILSNYGHEEYTCLYRFRVHSSLAKLHE